MDKLTAEEIAKMSKSLTNDTIADYIKSYAKEKCREQRIICSDHACIESPKVRKEVEEAPEPEFN